MLANTTLRKEEWKTAESMAAAAKKLRDSILTEFDRVSEVLKGLRDNKAGTGALESGLEELETTYEEPLKNQKEYAAVAKAADITAEGGVLLAP